MVTRFLNYTCLITHFDIMKNERFIIRFILRVRNSIHIFVSESLFQSPCRKVCFHACVGMPVFTTMSESIFPCSCRKTCFHVCVGKQVSTSFRNACFHVCLRKPVPISVLESLFLCLCQKACCQVHF